MQILHAKKTAEHTLHNRDMIKMLINNYDIETITKTYRILKKHYDELDPEETDTLHSLKLLTQRLNQKKRR